MYTLFNSYQRTIAAAFAAVVIVGFCGLTLDRGHLGGLPEGVIEIGELETLAVGETIVTNLPAVEVTADIRG